LNKIAFIFERQAAHLGLLLTLLAVLYGASFLPGFRAGTFLGLDTDIWMILSVLNAVLHQGFVWFCWRIEFHSKLLSRYLGAAAFPLYAFVFAVLILARPVLVTCLAVSNAGTLPVPETPMLIVAGIAALPSLYLFYSVRRYFGFRRAFGIDHFDPSFRNAPIVREGIFRFSRNAMYAFGFLALWVPGLVLRSNAALAVALFSHLYIWVHYHTTEKPDMDRIYGPPARS
jgi:hypothetical protein